MSTFSWSVTPASPGNPVLSDAEEQTSALLGSDIRFDGDYAITAAGDYALVSGIDALRAAVYRRLVTRPGEFRARPEYGVGVGDYVKRRRTPSTLDELRQRVIDQLSFDPRISDVKVSARVIDRGIELTITVIAAGRTLTFEPFDFRETTLRTLGPGGFRPGANIIEEE